MLSRRPLVLALALAVILVARHGMKAAPLAIYAVTVLARLLLFAIIGETRTLLELVPFLCLAKCWRPNPIGIQPEWLPLRSFEIRSAEGGLVETRNIRLQCRGILIVGGVAAAYSAAGVARRCTELAAASEAAAQAVRRIGLAYLRGHPEEASEGRLLAVVASRSALHALHAAPNIAAIFCIMDEIVRADFAADEIVKCSGRILAKSEARACHCPGALSAASVIT